MDMFTWFLGAGAEAGGEKQRTGSLSGEQFIQFANACKHKYQSPGFREQVRNVAKLGQDTEAFVSEAQKAIFEQQNIDGKFGIGQLQYIKQQFQRDAEVMQAFVSLVKAEELLLDEAELPEDDFLAKQEAARLAEAFYQEVHERAQRLPMMEQRSLFEAVQAASQQAKAQVPDAEAGRSSAVQRMAEQLRLVRAALAQQGWLEADSSDGRTAAADPSAAEVTSSALTDAEQESFLAKTGRDPR